MFLYIHIYTYMCMFIQELLYLKLLYYIMIKCILHENYILWEFSNARMLKYLEMNRDSTERSQSGAWETKGRKWIKEVLAARARATDRKRGGLYYYNVGRWARPSIGGANEGSVIITHDLTPSYSCKDLLLWRLTLLRPNRSGTRGFRNIRPQLSI